ncbi:proprotein convertase subtilisin/kexin type 1 inhibitor, like [Oncorhynchus keta]|uniref:proprotein convertase subtilisin/kexin type 1 inhibitor, like n=1 Tax=Oncorhynchus keta TaxID=8018 RepID=UPI00227A4C51|nr:proprotein convertase subtilisin/kexin type 1 inhibitor, like [Oncorhynchus keta]
MSGPLTNSCSFSSALFLLSISVVLLLPPLQLDAKSLSAARGVEGQGLDATGGGVRRLRRDLRDSLPYEAGMMSYPGESADVLTRRGGNELLYQPEEWRGQGLGQALQQLVENDQRREQETAYLAGLLRLLSEVDVQGPGEEGGEEIQGPGDFQVPYPPDYDETEQGMRMGKPQAAAPWQGLLDPQLTQALLNRYRQERLQQQAGLPAAINRLETGSQDRDEEALRYLVSKVLSNISPTKPQGSSGRRARRDLVSVSGGGGRVRASSSPVLHRSRRSLDSPPSPSLNREHSVGLLRVKRLGDMEGVVVEGPGGPGGEREGHRTPDHMVELQRMKRIDNELQPQPGGRPSRRRRALNYDPIIYDPELLIQHILHYLPQ